MMKMLAAAAMLSLSLTGVSLAQSSSDGSGGSTGGSQQSDTANDSNGTTEDGATTGSDNPGDTSAGDEPQCPPGQKSADSSATKADPKCVAE